MLFDSHTHLGSRQFDEDLPLVLERAQEAGVSRMVVPSTDLENARKCLLLTEGRPHIRVAVGIHPCDVDSVTGEDWIHELRSLAQQRKVTAIGEIGLDYFHAPPSGWDLAKWKSHQAQCLELQLNLAVELGLNVILHNRESWNDLTSIVKQFNGKLRGVFHCFTGTLQEAEALLEAGHLISFTGIVSFKNSGSMARTASQVPNGCYMLETDAPYLAPVPHRGKRCEPAFVADTARAVAALRNQRLAEVAEQTTHTAKSFFRGFE